MPMNGKKLVGSKQQMLIDSKVRIGPSHDANIVLRTRPTVGNLKPQRFVSLHHHSTF
jgi:hypothetical protein